MTIYEAMDEQEPMTRAHMARECARHHTSIEEFDAFSAEHGSDRTDAEWFYGNFLGY